MLFVFMDRFPAFFPSLVACFASIAALGIGLRNKKRLTDLNRRIDGHLTQLIKLVKKNNK